MEPLSNREIRRAERRAKISARPKPSGTPARLKPPRVLEKTKTKLIWATGQEAKSEGIPTPARSFPTKLCYPKGSILAIGGLYGIGKTTLAKKIAAQAEVTTIDPDITADALGIKWGEEGSFSTIYEAVWQEIDSALEQGSNVVCTMPMIAVWQRRGLAVRAVEHSQELHYLFLDGNAELSMQGQHQRGRVVEDSYNQKLLADWNDLRSYIAMPFSENLVHHELFENSFSDAVSLALFDRQAVDSIESVCFC